MRTPTEEREVSISFYTYNPDGTRTEQVEIYTSDYSYMLKFDRFCKENPEEWEEVPGSVMKCQGDVVGKRYRAPLSCLYFRGKTLKRNLTDEQRRTMADRFKK